MLIVGLTGGIGSGKSLVAEIFSKLGIPVYSADDRAKELMHNPEVSNKVVEAFGENSYIEGKLNRSYLAEQVFGNKEKLEKLNSIVHPAVRLDHKEWHRNQNAPYTIREAAILFESGAYRDCDKIIAINAPEEIRIERVMKRDGTTEDQVRLRMKNQWTDLERAAKSDFIIENDGEKMLMPQIIEIHKALTSLKTS